MQLILDTESDIHINEKMTTLNQESISNKLTNDNLTNETIIDTLNGNKENIECKDTINELKKLDNTDSEKDISSALEEVNGHDSNYSKSEKNEKVNTTHQIVEDDRHDCDQVISTDTYNNEAKDIDNENNETPELIYEAEDKISENSSNTSVKELEYKLLTPDESTDDSNIIHDTINSNIEISKSQLIQADVKDCIDAEIEISNNSCNERKVKNDDIETKIDITEESPQEIEPNENHMDDDIPKRNENLENENITDIESAHETDKNIRNETEVNIETEPNSSKETSRTESDLNPLNKVAGEPEITLSNDNSRNKDSECHDIKLESDAANDHDKCLKKCDESSTSKNIPIIPNDIIEINDVDETEGKESSKPDIQETDKNAVVEIKDFDVNKHSLNNDIEKDKEVIVPESNENITEDVAPRFSRLSNTLDILSDDEEDNLKKDVVQETECQKPIENFDNDDDIMLIEDTPEETAVLKKDILSENETKTEEPAMCDESIITKGIDKQDENTTSDDSCHLNPADEMELNQSKPAEEITPCLNEKGQNEISNKEHLKPLLPDDFLKTCKKTLAEMTREDLEEFCVLKIVEAVVDRSNLNEIKTRIRTMSQSIEDYKKKAMMLTKQNRDLQVVLKSVQEEQKKSTNNPIRPLKITRSVGMQVLMVDKVAARRRCPPGLATLPLAPSNIESPVPNNTNNITPIKNISTSPKQQKALTNTANPQGAIPVPRLVPAAAAQKSNVQINNVNNAVKPKTPNNAVRNGATQKPAEKRQLNRIQSVTVDLTDDEPPAKVINRGGPIPPVRLVNQQILMKPSLQNPSSPRKVFIPITNPQAPSVRPNQSMMIKSIPPPVRGPRAHPPGVIRIPQPNQMRMVRMPNMRHPAPLPDAMKQYQPPNWKALPPAPDLKLSKVENGIVISWKIEGYHEANHEEIASYQLYAYQETSSPPSTSLWKKIGDVKALPLPMACTLTQFMAGYKYYFAVRAVDIRSRLGPFSLPGSILLLNKV